MNNLTFQLGVVLLTLRGQAELILPEKQVIKQVVDAIEKMLAAPVQKDPRVEELDRVIREWAAIKIIDAGIQKRGPVTQHIVDAQEASAECLRVAENALMETQHGT